MGAETGIAWCDHTWSPFGGAGTTALVADQLNRHGIGIDLNPEYAAMAAQRIQRDGGLFAEVAA
jgi:hypothetical protein